MNYGIFDYINLDANKATNTNKNKRKNFNLENDLDEPHQESKPKLLFKNISKNSKNKSSDSKNSKNKSNIKAMKIKKENDIKSQTKNKKKNINNFKKLNSYSASNNKENKKRSAKAKRDCIPISSQKKKRLNKTKDNTDEKQPNETIKNRTFEGSINKKKENIRNSHKKYKSNKGSNHAPYKKVKSLIIPINNRETDFNDINKKINFDRSNITYQSDFKLNFGKDKSRSVDTAERKSNISSFLSSKTKPWAYSYKISQNDEDTILKIKKKRPLMSNSERQELFNKLYNDSKKRKEKYKKLSMEKEAKFNALYTFTPKIVPNKLNDMYLKNMADSKFSTNTNATTYYNNGGNSSMLTTTNNYSLLNKVDTNKNFNLPIVLEENKSEVPVDFINRLAEYEKIKKLNLEKIKNEVDMDTRGNFNKNKNKYYSRRVPYNNIENSQYYFAKRQKNLNKIIQNIYEEQGITFHPKTNKSYNDKIKNDIIERNKEFIKDKQEKLLKYFNVKEKECTFKPKINNLSTISILNNNKTRQQSNLSYKTEQNSFDVSKRLFDYQNKYKEKLEDIRSKYKENYSFKPEISKNTDIILNNRRRMMEQIKENEMNIINNIQEQEQEEGESNNNKDINENGNENYNEDDNDNDNNNGNENENENENENNSDNNNYSNENKNAIINNIMLNNFNNDINKQLLLKQIKLGDLEEISKRISELSEENMANTDQKYSSQKKSEEDIKIINNNKSLINSKKSQNKENNNFRINSLTNNNNINYYKISNINNNDMNNVNSDKLLELAQNLLHEDLISKKKKEMDMDDIENMNYCNNNGSKQSTNDFYSIMMNNSKTSGYNDSSKFHRKNYYAQEYDFDYIKGNRRIMDLNYYDNLL